MWEVHEIDGVRIGYGHTAIHRERRGGQEVLRIVRLSKMAIQRSDEEVEMKIDFSSLESPDGRLWEFDTRLSQGPNVMTTVGRVKGGELQLELTAQGTTSASSIPWSDEYGGLYAVELSLSAKPMKPGEERTIPAFIPAVNQLGSYQLAARQVEPVELPDGTHRLLAIDITTTLPIGGTLRGGIWMDESGEILKTHDEAMNMVTYRAPKEIALADSEAASYDLVTNLSVPVDRRLDRPYDSKRIRYHLRLEGGDPTQAFAVGPSQSVKPAGPDSAEVTVYAVTPTRPGNPDAPRDPPTGADLAANSIIQSDNPHIVAIAEDAVGDETDPWQKALALERFVHSYITLTNYSQAFATAADVAKSRTGDCTEHAVLLAALARARGLPARVAIGLVYTQESGGPAFGYHMWNEVSIDDRWIPLDATLARGGAGAARLKLTHSNMEGASALSCFLPVVQVARKLEIEILEAE
jgi:transglutaminase-like putative cysteine protease